MEPKHKGTEFSNISRVWEQNEKTEPQPVPHERGNEFGNVSETWQQNEEKAAGERGQMQADDTED